MSEQAGGARAGVQPGERACGRAGVRAGRAPRGTSDSGHFGDVALCVRADVRSTSWRPGVRAYARAGQMPCARQMLRARDPGRGFFEQLKQTACAPIPLPRLMSRCFGELVLAPRRTLARLSDDARNATWVEFWAVLQKIRPNCAMVLEFCAVFRLLF